MINGKKKKKFCYTDLILCGLFSKFSFVLCVEEVFDVLKCNKYVNRLKVNFAFILTRHNLKKS